MSFLLELTLTYAHCLLQHQSSVEWMSKSRCWITNYLLVSLQNCGQSALQKLKRYYVRWLYWHFCARHNQRLLKNSQSKVNGCQRNNVFNFHVQWSIFLWELLNCGWGFLFIIKRHSSYVILQSYHEFLKTLRWHNGCLLTGLALGQLDQIHQIGSCTRFLFSPTHHHLSLNKHVSQLPCLANKITSVQQKLQPPFLPFFA